MKTVKEVSRLTGVSVRALHHYDAIKLLKPTSVTDAGYRLYDDGTLMRLQSILMFRELRFPLRQIKEILDDYKANGKKDTFITLEPHLQTFSGLNALVGKSFDNPYKYENQQAAFTDAVAKLKELL